MAAFSCVSVRTHRRSSRRSMTLVAITPQSVDKAGKVLKLKLSACILLVSSFSSNVYKIHLTKCNCLCNFQISIFFKFFISWLMILNIKQEPHGPRRLPDKNSSINTYDYIITFLREEKTHYPLYENRMVLHLIKLESPSPKDALCQVWLKLAQWFWIRRFYFRYFIIISPWKRVGPFIWTNLSPHHPKLLCAKFGWNWLSGS